MLSRITRRIISLEELLEMSEADIRLAKLGGAVFPVAGGEETPEEKAAREERERKAAEEEDDDDDDDETPEEKAAREKREREEEEDDDDDYVRIPKSEAERLRRESREAKRKEKQREKERKAKEEKDKAERGRWEEIAADREKERDAEKERADKAEKELMDFRRKLRISGIAKKLMFIDPDDAHLYLKEEEMDDDDITERALKRVLREKKHLKSSKPPTGVPYGGNNGGGLTFEQIRNMSPEELTRRKSEVDAALEQMGKDS